MKFVDIENWERRHHYNFFKQLTYPHFNLCGNVDITEFYKFTKEKDNSLFISILYAVTKASNNVKEFRYRIKEDTVIEHEFVNPAFTIMTSNGVFSFCRVKFIDEFKKFNINTSNEIERIKNNVNTENEPERDDLIYTTCIPWVSFTSITHPIQMTPVDSIPRIAWGKYFEENGKMMLPLSVQAHHSLVDGIHVGQYFNILQEILNNPVKYL